MRIAITVKLLLALVATIVLSIILGLVGFAGLIFMRANETEPNSVNPFVGLGMAVNRGRAIQEAIESGASPENIRAAAVPPDLPSGVRVQVVDPSGVVLIDTHGGEGRRLAAKEVLEWVRGLSTEGRREITTSRAIYVHGKLWGYYAVSFVATFSPNLSLGEGTSESRLTTWVILGGQVLAFTGCVLVFWFFGLHLVRPIRQLSGVVGQIAKGDLSVRSNLSGRRDELGQLASDIDAMAASLQHAREQAATAERSRRYLVAAASHDLRTPLTAMLAHAEALRTGITEDPHKSLAMIEEKGLLLKRLIEDLFELAALDATQERWQTLRTDLAELVRRSVVGALPDLEAAGFEVEADIPEEPVWANLAPGKLERVLDNLLSNAAKYGAEGGWIGVRVARIGDRLRVEVADRGPGVPAEEHMHVFERFYRADVARSGQVKGSGLGLAIAREIVLRHGGSIGLDNPAEGGARFWLELPSI